MADVTIQALKNGPYLVKGTVDLVDGQGQKVPTPQAPTVALCRCGHSSKKPFCDGTHSKVKFQG